MKILHISNNFAGSKVHANLMKKLDDIGVKQVVYCPIRDNYFFGKNKYDSSNSEFIYSLCIKPWYKFVYHYKIHKLYNDLKASVDLKQVNFIHAHTLFSDGGVAYEAYKEFGIKYAIAIRSSDMDAFIKIMKHAYHRGRSILLHAEKIYFISAAIMQRFAESSFVRPILDKVKEKFVLQPNGIDDYWHQNITKEVRYGYDILYMGVFNSNKNVTRLANAVLQLRKTSGFENLRLILVGGNDIGDARMTDSSLQKILEENPYCIINKGRIYEKNELIKIMRSCSLFAMPSIIETFGLVYLEALSQNLPIIYSKGQGVDGLLDSTAGIGVNPLSVDEIKEAIKHIIINHSNYGNSNVEFSRFEWANIAQQYKEDYLQICGE